MDSTRAAAAIFLDKLTADMPFRVKAIQVGASRTVYCNQLSMSCRPSPRK